MDLLAQRLPPQNLEAETSVLGAVLLENEALNRVLEILKEDDFYRDAHRRIFSAILHLYEHSEPVDLITLSEVLKTRGELDDVGGVEYLNSLVNGVPTAANISYYAKIIKEKAILRKLINRATEIVSQSYSNSGDVDEFIDQAERTIFEISEDRVRPSFYPIKDLIKSSFKTIERLYEKRQLITGRSHGISKTG